MISQSQDSAILCASGYIYLTSVCIHQENVENEILKRELHKEKLENIDFSILDGACQKRNP